MTDHLTYAFENLSDHGGWLFFTTLRERGHRRLVTADLGRNAPDSVLPERAVVLHVVQGEAHRQLVAVLDDALVLLSSWRSDGTLTVAADHEPTALALRDEIKARVPVVKDERRVEVTFSDASTGNRTVPLDVRPWDEVRGHYPLDVAVALDQLVAHRPEADASRRLILWHGEPGTGKTSAVRALVHAWRDWVDPYVVSDASTMLQDGRYLRRMLLDADGEDWRLFVLEDAESLLHKQGGGEAMGKLLNLSDGLLGQGLRCLFLITTNEPVGALHPALVRPGRCLAQVEFGRLPARQAAELLGRPVARPMTLAEVMTAEPVQAVAPALRIGQYL